MRYYKIIIYKTDGKTVQTTFTTLSASGATNPNGLDLEFDVTVAGFATPAAGSSYVRIWGVPLTELQQSNNYNPSPDGKTSHRIEVYGGMAKGLPLANPAQANLLLSGTILQAFGNWVGADMTLDIYFAAGGVLPTGSLGLVTNWQAGTLLGDNISQVLKTTFPGYTADVSVAANLVLTNDEPGFYGTLSQFAEYVKAVSIKIYVGANGANADKYNGVDVALIGTKFTVTDGTGPGNPKQIKFVDLIGQPTYIGVGTVNLVCVMRGDVHVGDYIKLPKGGLVTTTEQSYSQLRGQSTFSGSFFVTSVRHTGRYRNPNGTAWVTVLTATDTGLGT